MSTDWKGEFVSLCFLVITSLHVHWLKGRIWQSVFLGHHFFTCTDWKGEFVSLCFLVITSLHVHWLRGRLFLSSWRLFLSSHHFFTHALIEREIVFVIPCLLVIHSLHVHWLKGRLFLSSHVSQLSPLFCFTCTQIERENGFVILHLCHPFFISAVTERTNICHILSLRLYSFIIICIYWLKKKKP